MCVKEHLVVVTQNQSSIVAFDVIRTFGMSNQIIFYNLQIIWLLLSIDLDT